jgi:hypothetical protein
VIRPYSDLLLHDMGDGLADDRTEFAANGRDWRTPPLWGIGLTQTVSGHTQFLHDGRARNLLEAVLWHGGEAQRRSNRLTFNAEQRAALLAFLNSLYALPARSRHVPTQTVVHQPRRTRPRRLLAAGPASRDLRRHRQAGDPADLQPLGRSRPQLAVSALAYCEGKESLDTARADFLNAQKPGPNCNRC